MADGRDISGPRPAVVSANIEYGITLFSEILRSSDRAKRRFTDFQSGLILDEEGYKRGLFEKAQAQLKIEGWSRFTPGDGKIAKRVKKAIELEGNNLLKIWPPGRNHQPLLDILEERGGKLEDLERALFDLYHDKAPEPELFERFTALFKKKYPLLAYLFFLKDMDRFVPVSPEGLEKGLQELGMDMRLAHHASWENYQELIALLQRVRAELKTQLRVKVDLIDAHSFVWVLGSWDRSNVKLLDPRPDPSLSPEELEEKRATATLERMVGTILGTIKHANGQLEERRVKEKNTDMSDEELKAHVWELMGNGRTCALTGLHMLYDGEDKKPFDRHFLVSPDRIDSDLGYVRGNIQIVCQFANFFKGHRYTNDEFRVLIGIAGGASS